ncbi:2-hydroxyacyl-CoA dehydratase family protein [Pelotomaculum terephthalicicum JT]|uniref:double-cubane-cluster-containing anaerobic reductase n=1 Tax=Pelotomaculum TaxID=191373 RepID=UPI0009C600C2|nr:MULTISPECIES: double-cubane-cluster-containing anaerobic reductase [Pelotomaculum]MCG9967384.1 2-hydroxyacyl-CoA dehydratase family protein [Pelotomaculum terephthalicicum JT]OPX85916.1 MAG: R-phenyllactate dehydratase beta subunit [Pelotomaculum sp. PtaB.Bin117]OPY60078.1 MAG: R-phenyllactate dehydratase beta subunit [Pelotomaculum sp. PtaU1.Bin065]
MATDYRPMWESIGIDLEAHDQILQVLPPTYGEVYLQQENRPAGMEYFDFVVNEIHGLRIQELQEHKANGGKVIGTFCVFVPEEIIRAAGGICIGLCSGIEIGVTQAETVLPRNICPLIKSFMGFKLAKVCPYFESCDMVVGETTCDGKKKAFEILNDYVPVHVLETPQMRREKDKSLWKSELQDFMARVEEITGVKINAESLSRSIKEVNGKRKVLLRLAELRKNNPSPISGKDCLLIEQIAMYDDVDRFTKMVNQLCDELETRVKEGKGVQEPGAPRIIVTGTPMAIPNWKMPHIIEGSGAVIVAEELCTGLRYFENTVMEDGADMEQMVGAIGERYLGINCACFTPNQGRMEKLVSLAKEYKADGIIHCSLAFCDPYMIEANRVEKVLKEQGIPLLKVETDYGQEDSGQLKTRVEAFLEMIR